MNFSAGPSVLPLIKTDTEIIEGDAVDVKALAVGPENSYELRREVQRLPEFHFTLAQRLRENLVLRDVDPGSDEPLEHSGVCRWRADAPDVTNRLVRTHDPLREVESAMLRH